MEEVCFYGYAEDDLSCTIMRHLFDYHNDMNADGKQLMFFPGFPENKRGRSNIEKLIPRLVQMSKKAGLNVFVLTDLDQVECSPALIQRWFPHEDELPESLVFRVAEREVEAWLLACRDVLANFLGIARNNFTADPDALEDPKEHLLSVIRNKGRKRFHREMLPSGNAHIGPGYNHKLCEFVDNHWDIDTARQQSNSLQRTINALQQFA